MDDLTGLFVLSIEQLGLRVLKCLERLLDFQESCEDNFAAAEDAIEWGHLLMTIVSFNGVLVHLVDHALLALKDVSEVPDHDQSRHFASV